MARIWAAAAGLFLLACGAAAAAPQSGDIGSLGVIQTRCDSLDISVQISSDWEVAPNPNHPNYRVFMAPLGQLPQQVLTTDNSPIAIGGLQASTQYAVIVTARSRKKNGWGIPLYRRVAGISVATPPCPVVPPPYPPTPIPPEPGDVRLRHEATGKCLFGHPDNGAPVKTWGCWPDPGMAISFEQGSGPNEVRIRIRATGRCLFGNPVSGGEVKSWVCWNDPNMVYVIEDLGGNRMRLRHQVTGQCMYGSPVNGGTVRNWPCWADPNMVWVIEPI